MKIPAQSFSKSVLAAQNKKEREDRLRELEGLINHQLSGCDHLSQFQERLYAVIVELENVGYSLGRWEYDCEVEIWGGPSYMDATKKDDLLLRSHYPTGVVLAWKDYDQLSQTA